MRRTSCWTCPIIAGATAAGIQLETVRIDFDATLDLRGFFGLGTNSTVGFPEIRYQIHVTGDATPEEFEALHRKAVTHSPNAQTILNPVPLKGNIFSTRIEK